MQYDANGFYTGAVSSKTVMQLMRNQNICRLVVPNSSQVKLSRRVLASSGNRSYVR